MNIHKNQGIVTVPISLFTSAALNEKIPRRLFKEIIVRGLNKKIIGKLFKRAGYATIIVFTGVF